MEGHQPSLEAGVAASPSESEVLNAAWQVGQNHHWTLGWHHDGKWLDLRGFAALLGRAALPTPALAGAPSTPAAAFASLPEVRGPGAGPESRNPSSEAGFEYDPGTGIRFPRP
jgi:hypothetical protein